MSTMTLEQVRGTLRAAQINWTFHHDGGRTSSFRQMADAIDAHLREREAAKAGVSDDDVLRACAAYDGYSSAPHARHSAMRAALEAVSLMLASARPIDAETVLDEYVRICAAEHAEHAMAADRVDAMRRALAHAGAASAQVPDVVTPVHAASGLNASERHAWALGWNDCRDAMLAAAPKPEKEG